MLLFFVADAFVVASAAAVECVWRRDSFRLLFLVHRRQTATTTITSCSIEYSSNNNNNHIKLAATAVITSCGSLALGWCLFMFGGCCAGGLITIGVER